jgi:hypothetical protein
MTTYDASDDEQLGSSDPVVDGRYQIWPEGADKPKAYTRTTTHAGAIEDSRLLILHYGRQVAMAMAARPDYVELVLATDPNDKAALNKLCEKAVEAVGGNVRSNRGTAAHGFMARVLTHDKNVIVPASMLPDIDAMKGCLEAHKLTVIPDLIEVVLVCDELGVAGRCDLICVTEDGELAVVDHKTGDGLEQYGALKTAMQLAIYAHATTIYDPITRTHKPMPLVRQDVAYALSRPLGSDRCVLIEVDIVAGWKYAFELVPQVRAARNHGKRKTDSMFRVLDPPVVDGPRRTLSKEEAISGTEADTTPEVQDATQMIVETFTATVVEPDITPAQLLPTEPLRTWIVRRLEALKKHQHGSAANALKTRWPRGVPGFLGDHVHTDAELRAVAVVLDVVEADFGVAVGETNPETVVKLDQRTDAFVAALTPKAPPLSDIPDEGRLMSPEDIKALGTAIARLDPAVRPVLDSWVKEARELGVGFKITDKPTQRRFEIYRALIRLAALVEPDDCDLVKATIGSVIPDFGMPTDSIGYALGTLTIDEAVRLSDTATAVRRDPPVLTYDPDNGRVAWATPKSPEGD